MWSLLRFDSAGGARIRAQEVRAVVAASKRQLDGRVALQWITRRLWCSITTHLQTAMLPNGSRFDIAAKLSVIVHFTANERGIEFYGGEGLRNLSHTPIEMGRALQLPDEAVARCHRHGERRFDECPAAVLPSAGK
jgi:hypothetical protein